MRITFITATIVIGALAALPCAAAAVADHRMVIRIYDSAALPAADRAAAISVASAILGAAGLDVLWRSCGAIAQGGDSRPCLAPLAANELAVRFVFRPLGSVPRVNAVALGYSLVDRDTRFGSLATIHLERVEQLASTTRVEPPTLLGRAVAHEIGHLLLGTTDHARAGLMRAVWPREMIEHNRAGDFQFTPSDVRALHAAVDARNVD
jgi:hypothetical protein